MLKELVDLCHHFQPPIYFEVTFLGILSTGLIFQSGLPPDPLGSWPSCHTSLYVASPKSITFDVRPPLTMFPKEGLQFSTRSYVALGATWQELTPSLVVYRMQIFFVNRISQQ